MWIEMKKTYAGPLGLFVKGSRHDIPAATRNELKKQDPDCLKNLDSQFDGPKIFASPQDKQYRPRQKNPYRTK
jgi:hypothetical protein